MLAAAIEAEAGYVAACTDERDDNGRRLVVRNGAHHLAERQPLAGLPLGDRGDRWPLPPVRRTGRSRGPSPSTLQASPPSCASPSPSPSPRGPSH